MNSKTIIGLCVAMVMALIIVLFVPKKEKGIDTYFKVLESRGGYRLVEFNAHTYYQFGGSTMVHNPDCEKCKDKRVEEMREALDGLYE